MKTEGKYSRHEPRTCKLPANFSHVDKKKSGLRTEGMRFKATRKSKMAESDDEVGLVDVKVKNISPLSFSFPLKFALSN